MVHTAEEEARGRELLARLIQVPALEGEKTTLGDLLGALRTKDQRNDEIEGLTNDLLKTLIQFPDKTISSDYESDAVRIHVARVKIEAAREGLPLQKETHGALNLAQKRLEIEELSARLAELRRGGESPFSGSKNTTAYYLSLNRLFGLLERLFTIHCGKITGLKKYVFASISSLLKGRAGGADTIRKDYNDSAGALAWAASRSKELEQQIARLKNDVEWLEILGPLR